MRLMKIETLSDDEKNIRKIADLAVSECGATSAHVDQTSSVYRWNGEIIHRPEYRLEIICTEDQMEQVLILIKENHNYELPAITWQEIGAEKRTADWIRICREITCAIA